MALISCFVFLFKHQNPVRTSLQSFQRHKVNDMSGNWLGKLLTKQLVTKNDGSAFLGDGWCNMDTEVT